jgi:tetratricopeptide (TPR) repeat protein
VATIRAAELARFTTESFGDGLHTARAVLEMVDEEIRVERRLSAAEQGRAEEREWDPRIADALRHSGDYGLAEYLAAGPELLREWRNGWDIGTHPRGAALVAAAVDVRRAGLEPPLSGRLLEEVSEHYLRQRGGDRLRPESMEAAWEWVLSPRRATTALMAGSPKDGFDVFDYLVDVMQLENTVEAFVPESVLRAAVEYGNGAEARTIGRVAYLQGYYALAAHAHYRALRWSTEQLGPENPDTLTNRNEYAQALRGLGRYEEAEREYRAITEISSHVLGPEHRDTLTHRNNLALALYDLKRLEEAEHEHRIVLMLQTKVLGPDHLYTLTSRNNLALTLNKLERLDEAEHGHRAVLELRTRLLGPAHPDTLTSRSNLALTLTDLGRLEEAEAETRRVVELSTRVSGPEHPETLISRDNLAYVLNLLGRLVEAEREYRLVLELRTRVLGAEHPHTQVSRAGLARVRALREG